MTDAERIEQLRRENEWLRGTLTQLATEGVDTSDPPGGRRADGVLADLDDPETWRQCIRVLDEHVRTIARAGLGAAAKHREAGSD